jgi:hypothetical protein
VKVVIKKLVVKVIVREPDLPPPSFIVGPVSEKES